jgi:hypothetical protein
MPPSGILYECKICHCLKKANGDRRQIGAAPHYFEIAAPTKVTMTTKAIIIIIIIIKSTISLY